MQIMVRALRMQKAKAKEKCTDDDEVMDEIIKKKSKPVFAMEGQLVVPRDAESLVQHAHTHKLCYSLLIFSSTEACFCANY